MVSRRLFIAGIGAGLASRLARRRLQAPVLRIGYFKGTRAAPADWELGARLGVDEARRSAALFGGTLDLVSLEDASRLAGAHALIGDDNVGRFHVLARTLDHSGVLLMNVALPQDDLRGAACGSSVFHVAASEAMCRDAIRALGRGDDVDVWESHLERFGADTLNRRFTARFGRPMTSKAWASWFSVKVLWETALAIGSADPRVIGRHLAGETTEFDGHKGRPLSFRFWDHQLRQPLYVRSGVTVVEVPASSEGASTRAALDGLGTSAENTTCRLAR
jgi:hypothetical protein